MTSHIQPEEWILQDSMTKKYFRKWTGIGPSTTEDIYEAERFETKEDAMRSPAYSFSFSFFEPVKL